MEKEEITDSTETLSALKALRQETDSGTGIPVGYISAELHSHGAFGAPKLFHVRNFSTEDLTKLALVNDEDVPIKLAGVLDELIYEDNVSIKNFHDGEVNELMILIYKTFFSDTLTGLDYTPTDADFKFLASKYGGTNSEAYLDRVRSLKTGEWKPKFNIDLNSVKYYDTPENQKTHLVRKSKVTGLECTYSYPKFGDLILIKTFLDTYFAKKDKEFAATERLIKFEQEAKDKFYSGEQVDLKSIPQVSKEDYDAYKEYELEKSGFTVRAARALNLCKVGNEDVSGLPLEERMKIVSRPEFDVTIFRSVADAYKQLKVGPVEEITILNPIQECVSTQPYSFRLFDFITAIGNNASDEAPVEFV